MPHRPRDTDPGIFHVFTHCVWAAPAHFRDDIDRLTFLRHLAATTGKVGWVCMAFCLMETHYHLLLEVDEGVLPDGMFRLNLAYARDFNRRHASRGHVQFRRYGAKRIVSEAQLLAAFRYVANNPVEAGRCGSAADWPWSSYAGTTGLTEAHSFVDASRIFDCFVESREIAVTRLRGFVERT